jgi:hypothetical protein
MHLVWQLRECDYHLLKLPGGLSLYLATDLLGSYYLCCECRRGNVYGMVVNMLFHQYIERDGRQDGFERYFLAGGSRVCGIGRED